MASRLVILYGNWGIKWLNNFVDRTVVGIIETDTGYYIQVDGAGSVVETDSAAVIKF